MATVKYNLGTVGGMAVKELFSGSVGSLTNESKDKITLNDDLTNYKFLVFDFCCSNEGNASSLIYYSRVLSVQQFINLFNNTHTNTVLSLCWGYGNANDYFEFNKPSTTKVLDVSYKYTQCTRIVGIN